MSRPGTLTISLDLELHWGTRDTQSLENYGRNLRGTKQAVPAMLEAFVEHSIHATWAIVGLVWFRSKEDAFPHLPRERPAYTHQQLNPYAYFESSESHVAPEYCFAPELVDAVRQTPHQELGSHTFSHYYCLEEGESVAAFEADLAAMQALAATREIKPFTSLVFPRNQISSEHLAACARWGIVAYRGNQDDWLHRPRRTAEDSLLTRAIRLADAYVNLTGHHGHTARTVAGTELIDVPASRFFRPYNPRLRMLEPLRLQRVKRDMSYCARHGLIYHLWWHPENFGVHTADNIRAIREVLRHYRRLHDEFGMVSLNMGEIAERVREQRTDDA